MSMSHSYIFFALVFFLILSRFILGIENSLRRSIYFLALNLAAVTALLGGEGDKALVWWFVAPYFILVSLFYLGLSVTSIGKEPNIWSSAFLPVVALIAVKTLDALEIRILPFELSAGFMGISYLAFRLSYLCVEVRNGRVQKPSFWEYQCFAFYLPTLLVGPISSYGLFKNERISSSEWWPSVLKILIGAAKYFFLAAILNQISFAGLMLDGHPHSILDFVVSCISYYFYLFANFSGFCDMVIGFSALVGFRIAENFDAPYLSRNLREFWTRWHITLSTYMRIMVFTPLSSFLVERFGIRWVNHLIALSICVVFVLIGMWHGLAWNYLAFGAAHAFGVMANHYYSIFLKRHLSQENFTKYMKSRFVCVISIAITFLYVSFTFFFFANSLEKMRLILHALT